MPTSSIDLTVYEAILARHSVRNFTPEAINPSCITTLLEAAVRAPTAHHAEPWVFAMLQDRSLLHWISEKAKPIFVEELRRAGQLNADTAISAFSREDFNVFYNAGTLIVIGAFTINPFIVADCWLAAENMMLAALTMGLGTCVIGAALQTLNDSEVKHRLGLPEKFTAIAPIVIGYPQGDIATSARKRPVLIKLPQPD